MKLFVKMLICVTLLALGAPFFLKGPDGRPLMDARNMGLDALKDLVSFANKSLNGIKDGVNHTSLSSAPKPIPEDNPHAHLMTMAGDELYYRWQDEDGIWQFTKDPPPSDVKDYVPIVTNVNANVMDSLERTKIDQTLGIRRDEALIKADKKDKENSDVGDLKEELAELGIENMNPLQAIPKIMENTRQIQENAIQRNKVLNEM